MDSVKDILVPLYDSDHLDSVLATAFIQAQRFHAHISAVFVSDDPNEAAAFAGEGLSGALIQDMVDAAEHEGQRQTLKTRLNFNMFLERHYIAQISRNHIGEENPETRTASLEFSEPPANEAIIWRARLSDVTIVPFLGKQENPKASEVIHGVLFESGHALVIAPPTPPKSAGSRICIGWNGTPECARALEASMKWLRHAEEVTILTSDEYQRRGPTSADVQSYLKLHGINAPIHQFAAIDRNVGEGMLQACREVNADMLTMGAYSHSRLRQMILGGVTRHILEEGHLTVLMSR